MGTLWNTNAFYVLYAEINQFDPTKHELDYDNLSVMDKWLLSRMNTMIKEADENLNGYHIPEAAKAMQTFVDELSNWYVRRSRERFWSTEDTPDRTNAYMTLYLALTSLCKCAAPMVPFITEEIYQNIVRSVDTSAPESIHLCDYPTADESMINPELESEMAEAMDIVVLGRAARNAANRKNRQPLSIMYVKSEKVLDDQFVAIVKEELNLKAVAFTNDMSDFMSYQFKPQLKTLGPKYGKSLGEIRNALTALDGNAAMEELKSAGVLKLQISTGEITLMEEDLLIETQQKENFYTISDNLVTVAIDITLTPELEEEGMVREVISKIQNMRKDSGFEVMDRINVTISGDADVTALVIKNADEIKSEVLADSIAQADTVSGKEWNINGKQIAIQVEKV